MALDNKAAIFAFTILALVTAKPPNIVFMVADDLGWNDVGFRNPDIYSPHIDKLAKEGVILDQAYVNYVCSPSRAAFMTGRYPYHLGLQHIVIFIGQPVGLPTNISTLPQRLKEVGYATHAVGKWHLGMCNWKYTPLKRGFDSFFGYYGSREDYYDHTNTYNKWTGLDLRENETIVRKDNGSYFTNLVTEHVEKIINNHNPEDPLFLYLPWHLCHEPLQVPERFTKRYEHIKDKNRRIYSGMVSALDEGVANVTGFLEKKGILDDTIIVFITDNGGPTWKGGNNYPLRGSKFTFWEGGTRATAFIHGKRLAKTGYSNSGMMHAVDWYPTILEMAGIKPEIEIDGVSQWPMLKYGLPSSRSEFIYNIDPMLNTSAIRMGDFKLIEGLPGKVGLNGWVKPPTFKGEDPVNEEEVDIKRGIFLYNLADDPTEHHNLADTMPEKVKELQERLEVYKKSGVPPNYPDPDPKANPALWNGTWSPGWC